MSTTATTSSAPPPRAVLPVRTRIGPKPIEKPHPMSRVRGLQDRMLRFSLGSLRAKLQIFSLVLVIVPGLLFAVISLVRARDALEHAVGEQLGEVAHGTLEELALDLSEERNNIRNWTHQDVMRDVMIGDLDKRVSRFLRSLIDESGHGPLDPGDQALQRAIGARVAQRLAPSQRRGYVTEAQAGFLVGFERDDDPERGWLALVMEPLTAAFTPVRDMERRLAVALAVVMFGALIVATFLGRRMSQPL